MDARTDFSARRQEREGFGRARHGRVPTRGGGREGAAPVVAAQQAHGRGRAEPGESLHAGAHRRGVAAARGLEQPGARDIDGLLFARPQVQVVQLLG